MTIRMARPRVKTVGTRIAPPARAGLHINRCALREYA